MILLKKVPTGRPWGMKKPPSERVVEVDGITCLRRECDVWEGPCGEPDEQPQYYRLHTLEPILKPTSVGRSLA